MVVAASNQCILGVALCELQCILMCSIIYLHEIPSQSCGLRKLAGAPVAIQKMNAALHLMLMRAFNSAIIPA